MDDMEKELFEELECINRNLNAIVKNQAIVYLLLKQMLDSINTHGEEPGRGPV